MSASESTRAVAPADERLVSLDALRGFDMFWIIGGEGIVHAAAELTHWRWLEWLKTQLVHPEWHGFAFYDLIFPLFLFLAGAAMPWSYGKRLERGATKSELFRHAIVRGLVLVLLGMIYNGLLRFTWPETRLPSVLGRIGLAYMFAALIFLNAGVRARLAWIVGLLVAYWAALRFIPVPGFGAGDLSPGHTLTDYVDRLLIPGQLFMGDRDPEGLFGTIPAIATALFGTLAGDWLRSEHATGKQKALGLALAGALLWGLGKLWNLGFPINKNLWSSSFVLYCAGWSALFLALFYLIIDVWKLRRWAFFFVVIGMNSILIYMAPVFVDFGYTTEALFGGLLKHAGEYRDLLFAIALVAVEWALLYLLYAKRIFLRV